MLKTIALLGLFTVLGFLCFVLATHNEPPPSDSVPVPISTTPLTSENTDQLPDTEIQHPLRERRVSEPIEAVAPAPSINSHEISGRVVLTDGSPGSDMRLVALRPDVIKGAWRGIRRSDEKDLSLFAETTTDSDGSFTFRFDHLDTLPVEFKIEQTNRRGLGQNDRLYGSEPTSGLEHVIPGGRLVFRIDDSIGEHESPISLEARFTRSDQALAKGGYTRTITVVHDELAEFFFREASAVSVKAVRAYDGAFATSSDLYVDPNIANQEQLLVLRPLSQTGRIRIEVRDQNDLQVQDFAMRISATDGSYGPRFVYSQELNLDGEFDGLPIGEVEVVLANRYLAPPSAYLADRDFAGVAIVSSSEVAVVSLRAELIARIAFDLQREGSDPDDLSLRIRYDHEELGVWHEHRNIWCFREEGGTISSISMTENGRYYTGPLTDGRIQMEVYSKKSGESVWSGSEALVAGQIFVSALDL